MTLRFLVAAAAAALLLLVRPLTPGLIVWTAVTCALVIAVLALLSRPPSQVSQLKDSAGEAGWELATIDARGSHHPPRS
ncbi:hypothetical protein [Leucobacter luti]|uniref:hypothetical protein n=1 Tax=Leucobacter luti TaxID=340320 RepID=UPI001C68787A|nr:hypothetical protein [Leucobacter luti]QYM76850.1 hypothetical protein K1X41_05500 [Leucobacter luti]